MGVGTVAVEKRMNEKPKRKRTTRMGVVVSDGMDKTVVALVEVLQKHSIYKKYLKRSKKYKVHDDKNDCHVGDKIRFEQVRPISKDKCWKLVEIIERAK
jgi:small subunit ribosomal protein S17